MRGRPPKALRSVHGDTIECAFRHFQMKIVDRENGSNRIAFCLRLEPHPAAMTQRTTEIKLARGIFDGKAMKSSITRALAASIVFSVASCASLVGQTTAPNPTTDNPSTNFPVGSEAQSGDSAHAAQSDSAFVIGNDDVLSIIVWKDDALTKTVPVRSDGKISLPLIGDIQAAGRTPVQLEQDITDRLKAYITDPQVTVIVQQINSRKFNILGEVVKPGSYPLISKTTIVDAIATAGGLRDFAKRKGIYVLRRDPGGYEFKYFFNYQDFIKGKNTAQNISLKPNDTVVVP
jgi:polysaccharide biosynthesis/export protein